MTKQYPTGKVLKDIPAPVHHGRRGRTAKFPLLEVGECMFFETQKEAASFTSSQGYQLSKLGFNVTVYDSSYHSFDRATGLSFIEEAYSFSECRLKMRDDGAVLMNFLKLIFHKEMIIHN